MQQFETMQLPTKLCPHEPANFLLSMNIKLAQTNENYSTDDSNPYFFKIWG